MTIEQRDKYAYELMVKNNPEEAVKQLLLKDKKINIVAAPGSGKTILGLELIVRLNSPCIILSPTITIRDQWADRFEEAFLNKEDNINDYYKIYYNESLIPLT